MPAKKQQVKEPQKTNIVKIGKSYYDIVDVFNQKLISSLLEDHALFKKVNVSNEEFKKAIVAKLSAESEKFKSWGWDVLSKNLRE